MASIYEMTEEFKTLWDLMKAGELDEEALVGAFETATEDLADKMEGYCKFLKNLDADINGLKEEEKRLATRRKVMENTKDRAKDAMKKALEVSGESKLNCGTFTVSIRKNPEKLVVDEPYLENIPEKFKTIPEPELDRAKLKEILQHGTDDEKRELDGIAHLIQDTSVQIK